MRALRVSMRFLVLFVTLVLALQTLPSPAYASNCQSDCLEQSNGEANCYAGRAWADCEVVWECIVECWPTPIDCLVDCRGYCTGSRCIRV
jgi:hypothetical protein